jgi:hypothetical protein
VLALADSLTKNGTGDLSPVVPDNLRLLAVAILGRAGLVDSAERQYNRTVGSWHGAVDINLLTAALFARQELGDVDSALAMTARIVQVDPTQASGFERDPWYQALRRHPDFPTAIKGISPGETQRR